MYKLSPFLVLLCLLLTIACHNEEQTEDDINPRKIEILFLGKDQEMHSGAEYMPRLASALAKEAINLTYVEDPDILASPEQLKQYDGLMLYANYDEITPAQEKGLLDYVKKGKAFLPIHCASYCFRNSEEYVELVGAQFKEHGTGVFTTTISDKTHPITAALDTFSTWDETYVHDQHNEDRTVLMTREENGHSEPWTWTREYGKGRVFYTAYGHDERTWNNPGFHQLLKSGIVWAVGNKTQALWETYRQDLPQLSYQDNVGPIPNYEKRDPAPQFQNPLSPEESKKLSQVPPGFSMELFASEPDIINPISMTWDEKGRLWVIETVDYPNTVRDDRNIGDDRIKICEDTDGDGRADKFTIFADQLNIPTSMTFVNGGVLVSQAPYFIFLKDTDGDDQADERKIVVEGWGTFDTHAGPSNLQYGMDNKIWGVVGYSGFEGTVGGEALQFRQGIYTLAKDFSKLELLTKTSNNTWGLGFTEENDVFASTANNTHSVFMSIPDHYFKEVQGIPAGGSTKIDGHYAMHPITTNYRQVDVFGGFTAAAGHHFYTARNYPDKYWNKAAFVCEPTGNLVHTAIIEKQGAGFIEKDGWNLVASADEWFSPVEAKVGPDGQVWVADWYNFIIQHNPTPSLERGGFAGENGGGNAHVNPLRDKEHGRIWRIVRKADPTDDINTLDKENSSDLLNALQSDNQFWRMTAQRLLVERGKEDIVPDVLALLKDGKGYPALHALWILDGLDLLDRDQITPAVQAALSHSSPAVRRAAIQILLKNNLLQKDLLEESLKDDDPQVSLALMLALTDMTPAAEIGSTLYEMSQQEEIIKDPFLSKALYVAGSKHRNGFIAAYLKKHPEFGTEKQSTVSLENPLYDDADWQQMRLPQGIEQAGLEIDGIIWFRSAIELTAQEAASGIQLNLGPIDDSDETWINGIKVGETKSAWNKPRVYRVSPKLLKEGRNLIAIKMEDERGGGGFLAEEDQFNFTVGSQKKAFEKEWKYKVTKITRSASNSLFEDTPLAEVLTKAYWQDFDPEAINAAETRIDQTIEIGVVKNEMKYDLPSFTVQAGETVEIIFKNEDFMQHNLIIGDPGSLEVIGAAADRLAADPEGSAKNYVPEIANILHSTRLVNPNETVRLVFKVPDVPGAYPYVCTFPGHWRIMNGIMMVEASPDTD